jgi:hypothetical protein
MIPVMPHSHKDTATAMEIRSVGMGVDYKGMYEGKLGVIDLFCILIVVMVKCMHTC